MGKNHEDGFSDACLKMHDDLAWELGMTPEAVRKDIRASWDDPGPDERVELAIAEHGPMSLVQIGRIMGCSRERVRQIEADALRKLRRRAEIAGEDTGFRLLLRELAQSRAEGTVEPPGLEPGDRTAIERALDKSEWFREKDRVCGERGVMANRIRWDAVRGSTMVGREHRSGEAARPTRHAADAAGRRRQKGGE